MMAIMKMFVTVALLVLLRSAVKGNAVCDRKPAVGHRPHAVSVIEFGAVGDGKTLNTIPFLNAMFYLQSFMDKGGALLYIPEGRWLTGSINLTSHITLFLAKGCTIVGSQDTSRWHLVDPLPSYGRGRELPGRRYRSLINGHMLEDVIITGEGGTIDGQGSVWWDLYKSNSLHHSRPHLLEISNSKDIVISNINLLNAPAFSLHPVYCSNVHVHNIFVYAPPEAPSTVGIVPDSSDQVCIRDCRISTSYDAISLKSGWDEYGISYGRPTTSVQIKQVQLQSSTGSALSFGSEMSGGIADILAENLNIHDSNCGIEFRTGKGRGGYIQNVVISDVKMRNISTAFEMIGHNEDHPDDAYDPYALPKLSQITMKDVVGTGVSFAGNFTGIQESPFRAICLSNISLEVVNDSSNDFWVCSNVFGLSHFVSPEPCSDLKNTSSSTCFSLINSEGRAAAF